MSLPVFENWSSWRRECLDALLDRPVFALPKLAMTVSSALILSMSCWVFKEVFESQSNWFVMRFRLNDLPEPVKPL